MNFEEKLFKTAQQFIKSKRPEGLGGAATIYSKNGNIYISVINASSALCIETGAILGAHKN